MSGDIRAAGFISIAFICTCAFFTCPCIAAEAADDIAKQDKAIIEEVRKQVEALPKGKQLVVGTEILRAALVKLKTKSARQRCLTSLGDLYNAQEQREDAVQFYKQAIDVDPTSELATYCRLKQISILEHSGKDDEASQLIRDLDAVRKGGPPFAGKALLDENVVAAKVELLVQKAEYDQAVKYCKKYYESFPDSRDVLLHYAEKVPFALRKERKYEEAIAWYEKLLKDFSSAKDNSIFYSNYITALSYCRTECDQTQLERIRKAIEEFAKNFPDNRNVSVFYAAYADVCRTIGQDEVAQEYYKRALAHPGVTEEMKQAIGQMIATIGADRIRRKNNVLEEAAARTSYFKSIFIWLNVCVVIVIALILFRRWSVRK